MSAIDICFVYGHDIDDYEDFWETRGIIIKDSNTGEKLVEIKPEDIPYEELIVNLLNKLGYSVGNVMNNLDDCGELDERHN